MCENIDSSDVIRNVLSVSAAVKRGFSLYSE